LLLIDFWFEGRKKNFYPFFISVNPNLGWQVVTKNYLICYNSNLVWQGIGVANLNSKLRRVPQNNYKKHLVI